jgi:hypothetical protein
MGRFEITFRSRRFREALGWLWTPAQDLRGHFFRVLTELRGRCFLPKRSSQETNRVSGDSHAIAVPIRRKFNQKISCSNLGIIKGLIKKMNRAGRNLYPLAPSNHRDSFCDATVP